VVDVNFSRIVYGTAGDGSTTRTVSYGFDYKSTPTVTAGIIVNPIYSSIYVVMIYNITTSGFQYKKMFITNSGSVTEASKEKFNWIAIGTIN